LFAGVTKEEPQSEHRPDERPFPPDERRENARKARRIDGVDVSIKMHISRDAGIYA